MMTRALIDIRIVRTFHLNFIKWERKSGVLVVCVNVCDCVVVCDVFLCISACLIVIGDRFALLDCLT